MLVNLVMLSEFVIHLAQDITLLGSVPGYFEWPRQNFVHLRGDRSKMSIPKPIPKCPRYFQN
jgi:hypothetical protein